MKSVYILIMLAGLIMMGAAGCAVASAGDLMSGISPNNAKGRPADIAFTESLADFSVELFKKSITDKDNSLISPLSVTFALAMTANGADNETLVQMEKLLGNGIPIAELNEYLYSYKKGLPSLEKSKLNIANSIWLRDDSNMQVNKGFLQTNADYYGASVYTSAFNTQTVRDINYWVKTNTDGMIDKILDEINENIVMYLINAVMFEAEWQTVYYKENVMKGDFTDISGVKQNVDFMYSTESKYLDDGIATGFIKPYANGGYSFAALLPNEGVSIDRYVETLTGKGFLNTLENAEETTVNACMPKFKYEYEIKMKDALITLGVYDAFDQEKADFSNILPKGNICISEVLHKTFICVDELGTKAGAVTMVAMAGCAAPDEPKSVTLDRPFVYAIIDNATNLPVFIGVVMTI